jgi:peptidoglycan/xylan/chitin deacetylase (PgdA/CDA1 family)
VSRVPVLMYHQVSDVVPRGFAKYVVTPSSFTAQMRWLRRTGYTPVDVDTMLASRARGEPSPRRPVVITFDDGFRDCAERAVPVLSELGFTAMFYLVAGLVGEPSRWLNDVRGIELPLADWSLVREIVAAGMHPASHNLTHPHLTALSADQCRAELEGSRRLLEDRLGRPVKHLAYPFGDVNDRVRAAAAESGYQSAVSVRIGLVDGSADQLLLPRVPVSGQESLLDFACRLLTAQAVADHVPYRLQRLRRAITTFGRGPGR